MTGDVQENKFKATTQMQTVEFQVMKLQLQTGTKTKTMHLSTAHGMQQQMTIKNENCKLDQHVQTSTQGMQQQVTIKNEYIMEQPLYETKTKLQMHLPLKLYLKGIPNAIK